MNLSTENTVPLGSITTKLFVLGALIFISWLATTLVWGIVQERQGRQEEVANEIGEQWSRPQTVAGPVITIPVEKTYVATNGERTIEASVLTLLPQKLSYTSSIETQIRTRGVYETPVYTTLVKGEGNFDLTDIQGVATPDTRILWDKAVVSLNVSDTRGISSAFSLTLNDALYEMLPASEFSLLGTSGVHAPVVLVPAMPNYAFTFELPLKGSRELSFLPLGEETTVTLDSSWSAPSFTGEFLPDVRNVRETGFDATWKVASYGKNIPQSWTGNTMSVDSEMLNAKAFGVGLYQEVDFYTMVDRATKYGILFIGLTFLTFFLYEVLGGLRIHPVQYLLVGAALAIFYLLLLSFAELIGFLSAYLFGAVATTLLITGYCVSVLKVKKKAFSIMLLLVALYTYLYVLLQLETYSLLFGSVLLFGVLGTVMFITRKLDWYSLTKTNQ
jgi:inner membrane protein